MTTSPVLPDPDYFGLWFERSKDNLRGLEYYPDYGMFGLWLRQGEAGQPAATTGKAFERYHRELFEAEVTDFRSDGEKFSFARQYAKPKGNLPREKAFYRGNRNPASGLIEGLWETGGRGGWFYLTEDHLRLTSPGNPLKLTSLANILLKMEMGNLARDIIASGAKLPPA